MTKNMAREVVFLVMCIPVTQTTSILIDHAKKRKIHKNVVFWHYITLIPHPPNREDAHWPKGSPTGTRGTRAPPICRYRLVSTRSLDTIKTYHIWNSYQSNTKQKNHLFWVVWVNSCFSESLSLSLAMLGLRLPPWKKKMNKLWVT